MTRGRPQLGSRSCCKRTPWRENKQRPTCAPGGWNRAISPASGDCTSTAGERGLLVMRRVASILLTAALLLPAGCGQSSEDKSKQQACDATSELQKQVNDVQRVTL